MVPLKFSGRAHVALMAQPRQFVFQGPFFWSGAHRPPVRAFQAGGNARLVVGVYQIEVTERGPLGHQLLCVIVFCVH